MHRRCIKRRDKSRLGASLAAGYAFGLHGDRQIEMNDLCNTLYENQYVRRIPPGAPRKLGESRFQTLVSNLKAL